MSETLTSDTIGTSSSPAHAWMRALELTAPIARNRDRILSDVIHEVAGRLGSAPALLSDQESFTYKDLSERANRYARWALCQGLEKGDVVCLMMGNRPEYMAIWLGITSAGVIVSLLNTNLTGPSLAHCIRTVAPRHILVAAEYVDTLTSALPHFEPAATIWVHGPQSTEFPRIDLEVALQPHDPLAQHERRSVLIDDLALYIYTSGTTGLPKPAKVSHGRVMQWSHWFSGMMQVQPEDRIYNCLPMYHSVGGVQAPGSVLVAGGTVVVCEKFSVSHFWSDILRWDCTLFQYIGEMCRYLFHASPSVWETEHRVRLACGNGLAPEVWDGFQDRFRIPRILEFYAATEGGVSLFNVQGKRGAIGHIPRYLAHRFSPALVRFDFETGEPARDEHGFCIRCGPNEPGEALGRVVNDPANLGSQFEGYLSKEASELRILRNVFEPGDAWARTGDLMRTDEKGFFYFVDRIGDTFRRKGENVATSEVAAVICEFPGITHAHVYGVAVPGVEGRVGMATLIPSGRLDLAELHRYVADYLPSYARPFFLRIREEVELTGTFKYTKTELVRQGYDPIRITDLLYFDLAEADAFVPLDNELYHRIQSGGVRL
jgi:fatty-acyl-CoA synthase